MTLYPFFEPITAELNPVPPEQSVDIAAIGYDGRRILVLFHRFPMLFVEECTRQEYEAIFQAEKIITADFRVYIAGENSAMNVGCTRWHIVKPSPRRKRK